MAKPKRCDKCKWSPPRWKCHVCEGWFCDHCRDLHEKEHQGDD